MARSFCVLGALALILMVVLAAPQAADGQGDSTGNNSTQLACTANATAFAVASNISVDRCPSYNNTAYDLTSGISGFSVAMAGASGVASQVSVGLTTLALLIFAADVPAAGGSIVAVAALGPNLSLANVSAALTARTIATSLLEPSTSTLIVLNITFPAATNATGSATVDRLGLRIPTWSNTRLSQPAIGTSPGFRYIAPTNASDAYYYWSLTPVDGAAASTFNASQWSTDPTGAIYMTGAVTTTVPIAIVSTSFAGAYFTRALPSPPPPPLAALRALPGAAGHLLVATAVLLVCLLGLF